MELLKNWEQLQQNLDNVLLRTLYALQLLWVMAVLDNRTRNPPLIIGPNEGDVIVEHIWIISGLSFFLQAESLGWSKKQGLQIYMLYSAIAGTFARFIASLREWGINLIRNGSEAAGTIERLCFSSRPELLMSCGTAQVSCL